MQFFHETLVDLRQVSRYPVVVPERFLLLGVQTFVAEIGFQPVPVVRLAVDDRNQVVGAERFVNIGVGAAVVSFDPLFDPVLGRQQDENGMAELRMVLHRAIPSISGIRMSLMIISGICSLAIWTPSVPL